MEKKYLASVFSHIVSAREIQLSPFAKEMEAKVHPRYTVGALDSVEAFYDKYCLSGALRKEYLKSEMVERMYLRA